MKHSKKLLASFLMLSTVSTFAMGTYYDRAKEIYNEGVLPQAEELLGFHLGKCFMRDQPSVILGGALYGKRDQNNNVNATTAWSPKSQYFEITSLARLQKDQTILLPIRSGNESILIDNFVSTKRPIITTEVRKKDSMLTFRLGEFMYCFTFMKK